MARAPRSLGSAASEGGTERERKREREKERKRERDIEEKTEKRQGQRQVCHVSIRMISRTGEVFNSHVPSSFALFLFWV